MTAVIRPATRADVPLLHELIVALAEYERYHELTQEMASSKAAARTRGRRGTKPSRT